MAGILKMVPFDGIDVKGSLRSYVFQTKMPHFEGGDIDYDLRRGRELGSAAYDLSIKFLLACW